MKKKLLIPLIFIFVFSNAIIVRANFVWPALYIAQGISTWWIIALSILIEGIGYKYIFKYNFIKSFIVAIVVNGISALLGAFLIPILGLGGEFLLYPIDNVFSLNTFDMPHIVFAYIIAFTFTVLIESFVLKIITKRKIKTFLKWISACNFITVLISVWYLTVN